MSDYSESIKKNRTIIQLYALLLFFNIKATYLYTTEISIETWENY